MQIYIPPERQIHESVLTAFGIICVFTASLLGISMYFANELNRFKKSVGRQITGMVAVKDENGIATDIRYQQLDKRDGPTG